MSTQLDLKVTRFEADAASAGYWLAFAARDTDRFYDLCDRIRAIERYERRWEPDLKCWWVSARGLRQLMASEPDLATAIRAYDDTPPTGTHTRSRRGGGSSSYQQQQQQRHAHAPGGRGSGSRNGGARSGTVIPVKVAESFASLHLLPSASVDLVRAALRVASRIHHPDAGGDLRTMQRLSAAADTAVAWIREQEREKQRAS